MESGDLTSWKDIADHLGVNVRTAQRWEPERGLPVRRLGGHHGRVAASIAELEVWRRAAAHKPLWWNNLALVRAYAVTITLVLVLGAATSLALVWGPWGPGIPSSLQLSGSDLMVSDRKGGELWRRTLSERPDPEADRAHQQRSRVWFGRFGREREVSTLFALIPIPPGNKGHALYCFSQKGDQRWEFKPGRRVAEGSREFPSLYQIRDFRTFPSPARDGKTWIAVASVHAWQHPSQVAFLDHQGRLLHEYWHSGHLDTLEIEDLDRDGYPEILLAGVAHPRRQATLVVLSTRRMAESPPSQQPEPVHLEGIRPRFEQTAALFPRTTLNEKFEQHNAAYSVDFVDNSIIVLVKEEMRDPNPYLLYRLTRDPRVLDVQPSPAIQSRYRELKAAGLLNHELSEALVAGLGRGVQVLRYGP